jgi:sugar lactone lactonase YvrE
MKMMKIRHIIVYILTAVACIAASAREYFITPDGETIYYSPPPRILIYKPTKRLKDIYRVLIPHGTRPQDLREPTGLSIDRNNRIYVSDAESGAIKIYDIGGRFLRQIVFRGKGPGDLHKPGKFALSPFGDILIKDRETPRIHTFDFNGRELGPFIPVGEEKEKLIDSPTAIAIAEDGTIFISDTEKNRIARYSFKKHYETSFGRFGSRIGEFNHPLDITMGRDADLYVADTQNHRIQVFRQNGKPLRRFGEKGRGRGQFIFPSIIAADRTGKIVVADQDGHRIQFYTPFGYYLGGLSFEKPETSGYELKVIDLAFDSIGALYLIDGIRRRILKILPQQIAEICRQK